MDKGIPPVDIDLTNTRLLNIYRNIQQSRVCISLLKICLRLRLYKSIANYERFAFLRIDSGTSCPFVERLIFLQGGARQGVWKGIRSSNLHDDCRPKTVNYAPQTLYARSLPTTSDALIGPFVSLSPASMTMARFRAPRLSAHVSLRIYPGNLLPDKVL